MAELLHYIAHEVSGECISFWGKQDSTMSNSKTICSIHNIGKHKQSRFSGLHMHLIRGQNLLWLVPKMGAMALFVHKMETSVLGPQQFICVQVKDNEIYTASMFILHFQIQTSTSW